MLYNDCSISPASDTIIPLNYVLLRCVMMKWIDRRFAEAQLAIFFTAFSDWITTTDFSNISSPRSTRVILSKAGYSELDWRNKKYSHLWHCSETRGVFWLGNLLRKFSFSGYNALQSRKCKAIDQTYKGYAWKSSLDSLYILRLWTPQENYRYEHLWKDYEWRQGIAALCLE